MSGLLRNSNHLGLAIPVLVEDDVKAFVDERAVTVVAVEVTEERGVAVVVVRAEERLEGISGLPSVV